MLPIRFITPFVGVLVLLVVDGGGGRVFVVAHSLAGDDLPLTATLHPSVGFMIASSHGLAEDSFAFILVKTYDGGIADKTRLRIFDFDRTGVAGRKGCDVRHERIFVHGVAFFVEVHGVIGDVFFPRSLITGGDAINIAGQEPVSVKALATAFESWFPAYMSGARPSGQA